MGHEDSHARFNRTLSKMATGIWGQAPPLGFEGGDSNLYRYVGNDPTNYTDPDGMEKERPWWKKGLDLVVKGTAVGPVSVIGKRLGHSSAVEATADGIADRVGEKLKGYESTTTKVAKALTGPGTSAEKATKALQELPGGELIVRADENGGPRQATAEEMKEALRDIGEDMSIAGRAMKARRESAEQGGDWAPYWQQTGRTLVDIAEIVGSMAAGKAPKLSDAVRKKLGGLAQDANKTVREVIRERGGNASNVRKVGPWADKTLKETAEAAVAGGEDAAGAETAIKIAKQARQKGQEH